MSKRFIDTGIWEKAWFMELSPAEKMAVMFIMTKCDNVGVWQPNFKLAAFQIGQEVDWPALVAKCHGNIEVLPDGKWFMVDFCRFQYGELSEDCKPHQSYLALLEKHGLSDRVGKGYPKAREGVQDKDKDKEEEKEKDNLVSCKEVVGALNAATHRRYSSETKATQRLVKARVNDGHTLEDFEAVIASRVKKWGSDPKMMEYLRPETLFGTKFDSYLAQAGSNGGKIDPEENYRCPVCGKRPTGHFGYEPYCSRCKVTCVELSGKDAAAGDRDELP